MHPTAGLPRFLFAAVVTLAAMVANGCSRTPADGSAEAGFARDMATHHAQAVEMAFMVRDSSGDGALRALAADIIVTQSTQRGIFLTWLQEWGLPQASAGPRMAWMQGGGGMESMVHQQATAGSMLPSHGVEIDRPLMVGMASGAELDALRHAIGQDAEILFLRLMIRHHESGVRMARALLEQSHREEVVSLARRIDRGQLGEINTMTAMLRARGSEPLPSLLPK